MNISLATLVGRQVVEAYGDGGFRIGGTVHSGSVIVLPDRTVAWDVAAFDEVTWESLELVLEAEPKVELLLLGCGTRMEFVKPDDRQRLREAGIVTEAMDTGAACRTFNVLLGEERFVAAALIAV